MFDSRKIMLFGFPLMLALLALGAVDFAVGRVRAERESARVIARERLEGLLERAAGTLEAVRREQEREQGESIRAASARAKEAAERAGTILCSAVARIEAEDTVERERARSTVARMLELLGGSAAARQPASAPASVISESEPALRELLGGELSLRVADASGRALWKGGAEETFSASRAQAATLCNFTWKGAPVSWKIEAAAPSSAESAAISPKQLEGALTADPMLQRELGERFSLALVDAAGEAPFSLPAGAYRIDSPVGGDLGRWVELDAGAYSGHMLRLTLSRALGLPGDWRLAAQAVVQEPDDLLQAWAEVQNRPGLLVVPLAGAALALLGVVSALYGRPEREEAARSGRRLVSVPGREIDENARVILAEMDGGSARVGGIGDAADAPQAHGKRAAPVNRLSSLERLRRTHCPEYDGFDLTASVRSPVLRELLREVGRRHAVAASEGEDKVKTHAKG